MRCRAFTFWLNLGWFLFIYETFIVKEPSSILSKKNMVNLLFAFFLWKACTFSSFERFLFWKSRNYSQHSRNFLVESIYLQSLIIGVVFLHYTWREERPVWLVFYPYFFSFFRSSFFSFSICNDSQEGK